MIMAKKLWGGRFGKEIDPDVENFTKSIKYDIRLALYDVIGSQIHVSILEKAQFINPEEARKLKIALDKICNQIEKDEFELDEDCEDIHTNIQNLLEKDKNIGDLALKLHTARSRNDQVLFDLKLFCKVELLQLAILSNKLNIKLLEVCEENKKVIIPGYTHLQHAQLVYLSDYLKSYIEMLNRDSERLINISHGIKPSLGAGAFAGTPIEPSFYNEAIRNYFEENKDFAKGKDIEHYETISKSLDTVSNRDFVIETLSALAILGMHLSRLAEDLIIWSTKEFGFIEIDDAFATGSSLMPQKKNPDVLELIRGYTGVLYGNLMNILTIMKGLPLTYNRDMQLDKPPLFSSVDILTKELKILPKLIGTLKWNKDIIDKNIKEDEAIYATDFVYYLIKKKKMPFKTAHDIIGKLMRESIETGRKIKNMTDKEIKRISDKLEKDELVKLMDPIKSVTSRISIDRKSLNEIIVGTASKERRKA